MSVLCRLIHPEWVTFKLCLIIILLLLASCQGRQRNNLADSDKQVDEVIQTGETEGSHIPAEVSATAKIGYRLFEPEPATDINIEGFCIGASYSFGNQNLVVGYYKPIDGNIVPPDSEYDWGDRLMLLNSDNRIVYKSVGVGDPYLFEPYFFGDGHGSKAIIICQMGYEYFFGAEAFILENGEMAHMGTLDIEGNDPEQCLAGIVDISEENDEITFTFRADSLILKPASEAIPIPNENVKYVYGRNRLLSRYRGDNLLVISSDIRIASLAVSVADIDGDDKPDSVYIGATDNSHEFIVCRLSSRSYEPTISHDIYSPHSSVSVYAGDGSKDIHVSRNFSRTDYTATFRYDKTSGRIKLGKLSEIKKEDMDADGAQGARSYVTGVSVADMQTGRFNGSWEYVDNGVTRELPETQTNINFPAVYLEDFSDDVFFDFSERSEKMWSELIR